MPRPRVTETAQWQCPAAPPSLRTSSSDSEQHHPRPRTERTARPADGCRTIRAAQSDPSGKKKLGTRIANLESQLGLAQEELKSLKDQLVVSTGAATRSTHDHLDRKPKNHIEENQCPSIFETEKLHDISSSIIASETSDSNVGKETDVFEVPVEKLAAEDEMMSNIVEKENPVPDELASRKVGISRQENESLKSQADDESLKLASARAEIDELIMRLANISQELEKSRACTAEMTKKLEVTEKAKEDLENEMKRLRVQSEQWRKAADAAASFLAGGVEISGRRLSERCGSMDKVYTSSLERANGYVGSPGLVVDDVFVGCEKRKGSGIRMFGEVWKKKGQK
ncbi:hypothetical protein OROGR_000124 [Orobanche gracilis]